MLSRWMSSLSALKREKKHDSTQIERLPDKLLDQMLAAMQAN